MQKKLLYAAALITIFCAVEWTDASNIKTNLDYETANLKVEKVFSAKDGAGRFQAYMVNWKDQEVIVSDTLVKTDYKVGDTIRVLVMKHKYPNEKPGPELLSFQVTPPINAPNGIDD